ncbi:hypothetical protein LWI29_000030 [Acer saccharum]|uniref:Increased DNA methylation 1 C-terminal domain-containing protein n=1 Tax=Acer saccharum TaxID=4024 RepID=A0AA39VQF1_ACESA|nr:hypothetical protein LWI29_000030 [Acer saccharum]
MTVAETPPADSPSHPSAAAPNIPRHSNEHSVDESILSRGVTPTTATEQANTNDITLTSRRSSCPTRLPSHLRDYEKLISRGEEKLPNTCMNVIKKKREEVDACSAADVDVRWRVLKGKKVDTSDCGGLRTLLSKVVAIFHVSIFVAFINRFCKRSLKTQDFHGMYCAILTVNQVVVSAGIFRIFGEEVAELPLVATSKDSQGQVSKSAVGLRNGFI